MDLMKFRDLESFKDYRDIVVKKRWPVEKLLASENEGRKTWKMIGYCDVCERETRFLVDWSYSADGMPNFRERLLCEHCGLNSRQRFMAYQIKALINTRKDAIRNIYLYEQVTVFYSVIKEIFKSIKVVGSEYFGFDSKPGMIINGIRHEDALNLSFEDLSTDIIVSNDVYEHVPDISRALKEAYRVLSPDGVLLFSVPFHYLEPRTKQRAALENGKLIHLLEEQYHGNPVSDKGSLVFCDFGWDLLDLCKSAGFKDVYMLTYYSFLSGYLGEGLQFMFVAEK